MVVVCLLAFNAVVWWLILAGQPRGHQRKRIIWDEPPGSGKLRPLPSHKEPKL